MVKTNANESETNINEFNEYFMTKQDDANIKQEETKIKQAASVPAAAADSGEPKEEKVDEFRDKYLRALADYQNLERQTAVWKEAFVQYSNVPLISKILEVLDDLEKAQEHIKDEGLQLVINKLKNILTAEGVEELELVDKEYNPSEAEVVSTETGLADAKAMAGERKDNIVTKVLQKGYKINDKIIRPAKVVVATAAKSN